MSDDGIQVWAPMEVVEGLLARAEKAEAAIQRVRELCDNKQREVEESDPLFGPPLTLTVPDVLRALDVPCPTCSGPIRETVGLVCQTCGTDYGDSDD